MSELANLFATELTFHGFLDDGVLTCQCEY